MKAQAYPDRCDLARNIVGRWDVQLAALAEVADTSDSEYDGTMSSTTLKALCHDEAAWDQECFKVGTEPTGKTFRDLPDLIRAKKGF